MRPSKISYLALFSLAPAQLSSQAAATVRPLGPVVRVSAPGLFGSVSAVRSLPDGSVIVNDLRRGRVVWLDSAFASVSVIADSTNTAPGPLGIRTLGMIAYRGDSTIVVDPAASALLVLDSHAKLTRVQAVPR